MENIDEALKSLLTDKNCFENYEDASFVTIFKGGDYGKGSFTMLLTMHTESTDEKRYLDEVVREIDSEEDNVEFLDLLP